MARIQIPPRLDEHLGDSALASSVRLYVQRFDQWVSDDAKGLFFFPEYTDHGPKHVSWVLAGAEALILEDSWKAVTPEDVAVLVTAVLLHDSAMHLSADGFLALFDPARSVHRLDDKTWPELFEAFFAEARRWNQRQLHSILGDETIRAEMEPDLVEYIQLPAAMPNPESWSLRYRKFLGEFIRRHHTRLAHEIALSGFPGQKPNVLVPLAELSGLADLAGLVARSHNMRLRDTFSYLEKRYYGRMTCQNVHPVFLMVLLRIADYLEIRADRVNPTALQIQRLRSPISQEEQLSHLSVHEVRPDEHDEEAIFVIAKPASARMFLKLQSLLKGLQAELDTSWAVLGEVYSRHPDLRCFGIRLRRVRSNLDNPADFMCREEPTYFPIQAAFETTGADLLKLLIKPLYGDFPEIGIRELLQNALDAVHELRQWAREHGDPAMKKIPRPKQRADVLVSIDKTETGEVWLTVRDKGIGMTAEVVRDFFLKAGASYRASTVWRQNFEDEKGGSKILRSGRFGIGALAAFLLGDRMEIFTRYVNVPADSGIYFSASINDDIVELQRIEVIDVGTTVRIRLTQQAEESLDPWHLAESEWDFFDEWDWYTADDPRVDRYIFGQSLRQKIRLPSPGDKSVSDWSEIVPVGFKSILWGFSRVEGRDYGGLACNGIIIKKFGVDDLDDGRVKLRIGKPFACPLISVFDPDGNLPLNLQRDALLSDVSFMDDVLTAAVCELCAFLLSWGPSSVNYAAIRASLGSIGWPLFGSFNFKLWPIFYTKFGITISLREMIMLSGFQSAFLLFVKGRAFSEVGSLLSVGPCGFGLPISSSKNREYFGDEENEEPKELTYKSVLSSLNGKEDWEVSSGRDGLGSWRILEEGADGQWQITSFGKRINVSRLEDIRERIKGRVPRGDLKVIELSFLEEVSPSSISPFVGRLMTILDQPIIPYDAAERKRQLPRAFERLEKFLEKWKPENLRGWRLEQVKWFQGGIEPVGGIVSRSKKGGSRSRRSNKSL